MAKVHARQGKTSEHYTPAQYVEAARAVLDGVIDLDPASCDVANATVKATRFFTRVENGLLLPWGVERRYGTLDHRGSTVFVNPPYSDYRGQASAWAQKLLMEYDLGCVHAAVMLVNATMLYHLPFQELMKRGAVCITDHRIRFVSAVTGLPQDQPPQPNAFIYVGPNVNRFGSYFAEFGVVMEY